MQRKIIQLTVSWPRRHLDVGQQWFDKHFSARNLKVKHLFVIYFGRKFPAPLCSCEWCLKERLCPRCGAACWWPACTYTVAVLFYMKVDLLTIQTKRINLPNFTHANITSPPLFTSSMWSSSLRVSNAVPKRCEEMLTNASVPVAVIRWRASVASDRAAWR